MSSKEKFATQVNPEVLAAIRGIAQSEGRQLQALIDEALRDLIEKRKSGRPRAQRKPPPFGRAWVKTTRSLTATRGWRLPRPIRSLPLTA